MSTEAARQLSDWKVRHAVVTWIGNVLNLLIALPLFFAPSWMLGQLGIPEVDPIWAMVGAGLLFIITVFYIPMTIDIDRYRVFCWLSILPSRIFGASFFIIWVAFFGAAQGFLTIAVIDAVIAIAWLQCMINISRIEQAINMGRA